MSDPTHFFGTADTEIKLSLVREYLETYTKALRGKFRRLWYFDAFAGTGTWSVKIPGKEADFLTEGYPERVEQRRGSATIAIDIEPRFDKIFLMDALPKHVAALMALREAHSDRDILVLAGDANKLIPDALRAADWRSTRAVMFLDPYGMQVEWETLQAIANTKAVDVWYLFSLSGLYRQAARNIEAVDPTKRRALTRMLGTDAWEQELYSSVDQGQHDIFSGLEQPEIRQRHADVAGLEAYVRRRLLTIFPLVLEPFALPVRRRPQLFSLFFAVSNDDPRALGLARKFGSHILKRGISS
ncbi:three-Cys-motif partner protein TcmP [Mesorhizobium sp. M0058]|uniref:three-Cys-motif partner protein TcmP n=1 Tax=Mesorhizobium sp. M0058 TaxID=2956865 RepID=UPI0033352035